MALTKTPAFAPRGSKAELEAGLAFTPKFDAEGLIPAIVTDMNNGEALMFAFMNAEALALTIETGVVHFWSRSRAALWKKGGESGNVFNVVEMRADCDQDVLWLRVTVEGDGHACHTGRRSCFYRLVPVPGEAGAATHLVLAPDADDAP
jgi:phosphoribosyl-AMP cyclohydrolase